MFKDIPVCLWIIAVGVNWAEGRADPTNGISSFERLEITKKRK